MWRSVEGAGIARALRHYRLWFVLGWPACLGLVGVFWLMVAKPQFGA
nr:DUF2269 family protein [Thioclava indica]